MMTVLIEVDQSFTPGLEGCYNLTWELQLLVKISYHAPLVLLPLVGQTAAVPGWTCVPSVFQNLHRTCRDQTLQPERRR